MNQQRDKFNHNKQGFGARFVSSIYRTYLESIPFISTTPLDGFCKSFLTNLILWTSFVLFIALCYYSTITSRTTFYLSPATLNQYGNSVETKDCQVIVSPVTGTYLASSDGFWEGDDNFQYTKAQFQLNVVNYRRTIVEYQSDMQTVYESLASDGNDSKAYDLGYNLLFWMTKTYSFDIKQSSQRFFLTGSALTVYNRDFTFGSIVSKSGVCNISSTTLYSPSTGIITLSYSYSEFVNSSVCMAAVSPAELNRDFYAGSANDEFYAHFDVRSLVTAASINMQINSLKTLIEIEKFGYNETGLGAYYSKYYDPKYPGMNPISCYSYKYNETFDGLLSICFVKLGRLVGFPFFNQVGTEFSYPTPCNCNNEATGSGNSSCNLFKFISGFLFWSIPDDIPIGDDYDYTNSLSKYALFAFFLNYLDNASERFFMRKANSDAFNASFVGSVLRNVNEGSGGIWSSSSTFLSDSLDFCTVTIYNTTIHCSVIIISSYDLDQETWSISSNYYQLSDGACTDSISLSQSTWNKLVDKSFTQLTQDYQKCVQNFPDAIYNAVGVSQGFVSLFLPIMVLLFLIIANCCEFFCCFPCNNQNKFDEDNDDEEIDDILKELGRKLVKTQKRKANNSFPIKSNNNISLSYVQQVRAEKLLNDLNDAILDNNDINSVIIENNTQNDDHYNIIELNQIDVDSSLKSMQSYQCFAPEVI
eukprot:gene9622-12957_t